MQDIQTILDNHTIEVQGLLRKHKISGPLSIDTIKKAYDAKGEPFMMELLQIITPTSSFLGIGQGNGFLGLGKSSSSTPEAVDTIKIADDGTQSYLDQLAIDTSNNVGSSTSTGSGWDWWNNLLSVANKTGQTIGAVKNDISGKTAEQTAQAALIAQQDTNNTNMLLYVAAGFIALIIIFLIFKK